VSLKTVNPDTLFQWLKEGKVRLIDIREASEFIKERIPGAILYPYTSLAPGEFKEDERRIGVFYCRSGHRTALLAERLVSSGFDEVYHLEGGILAWKRAGLPLLVNQRHVPDLTRQVFLLAGLFLFVALFLLWRGASQGFILGAIIALSLFLAGLTDPCLLKAPLFLLPWNRSPRYIKKKFGSFRPKPSYKQD